MGNVFCGERHITTDQLQERVSRVASGLESLGVGPGDGVALYLRNDLPYFEAGMGAGALGAYAVPVNWHYTQDEARYLLEDSGVKVLVIHADLLPLIRKTIPKSVTVLVVPTPPEIRSAYGLSDEQCRVMPGDLDWNVWRADFKPRTQAPADVPSTVIYTSGTTGRPKGVKRPKATPESQQAAATLLAASYGYTSLLATPEKIVTAVIGPMYHSAPNAHAGFSVRAGANVHVTARFEPEALLKLIEEAHITHLNMVPIMFNRLLKLPDAVKRRYDLSSLQFVAHAAAPCPPPIKRAMIEWWGPVINEYYGSTEMGNVTFCTAKEWLAHPGTVGKPFPFAEVRVIDENGKDVAPREVGEVIGRVKGLGDFTYHGDPEKRRKADRQGLIAPGDVGYFDEDGFLYLCSRSSDMIISGGVNIYPAEIEAELHKMPGIADCAVFGIPDEEFGEAVCAVVQAQQGFSLDEASVRAYLREHMAGFKVPKRVDFQAELPREDSGKIFKRKLREPYWEGLDRRI